MLQHKTKKVHHVKDNSNQVNLTERANVQLCNMYMEPSFP